MDGKDSSLVVGEEDRELTKKLRREEEKLKGKEGSVRERGCESKVFKGEGVRKLSEKKIWTGEGVEKRRSKTTGREALVAIAQASPHSCRELIEKEGKRLRKGDNGLEKQRSKTTGREALQLKDSNAGREALLAAVQASPHSHISARRRGRWNDDGNVEEKKIALDLEAGSDAFLPIISEIEELIGKGRMETEKARAVTSLDKNDDTSVAKPFLRSASPQSTKQENSEKNYYTECFQNSWDKIANRGGSSKGGGCQICGETGHLARGCPHSGRDQLKGQSELVARGEAATVNSLPTFSQEERTTFVGGLPQVNSSRELYF